MGLEGERERGGRERRGGERVREERERGGERGREGEAETELTTIGLVNLGVDPKLQQNFFLYSRHLPIM